jgi:hypothetical protein
MEGLSGGFIFALTGIPYLIFFVAFLFVTKNKDDAYSLKAFWLSPLLYSPFLVIYLAMKDGFSFNLVSVTLVVVMAVFLGLLYVAFVRILAWLIYREQATT